MTTTPTPIFPQTVGNATVVFTNATGTAVTTLLAGPTNGCKIESIGITNTDTNAYTLNVYIVNSSTNYLVGTVSVPLSSGNTASAPTVDLLNNAQWPNIRYDANGNKYLYLANGYTLAAAVTGTITSAKNVTFHIQYGAF